MRINGSIFDPLRPDRAGSAVPDATTPRPQDSGAGPSGQAPAKSDSVQISDAARRLQSDSRNTFDPERVAELRTKVLTGAYNTLDVVDQVARRMLSRGDL